MKWYVGPDGERGRFTEGAPVPQGWIEETVLVPAGPFDHDGDGHPGGSLKGADSTVAKGKAKKAEKAKPAKAKRK